MCFLPLFIAIQFSRNNLAWENNVFNKSRDYLILSRSDSSSVMSIVSFVPPLPL